MAAKTRRISTLIESQLPGFIASEYENFAKVLGSYYEQLESQGQPLDIINNLTTYRDINYYDKNLLTESSTLVENLSDEDTTIVLEDATSFPEQNGYVRIGNEICFYKERTDTDLLEVSRGVSGNVTLGDLYEKSEFVTTSSESHLAGVTVYNVSNLFLYAFVKSFESQYLNTFPEKYLKSQIDKRTLIKNITNFYRAKGTEKSIQFIFNSIISTDETDVPKVYNPKDLTLKSSTSDWVSTYSLKVKVLSGDPTTLIGQKIEQLEPKYVSAIVDNVKLLGSFDGETLYELILDKASIFDEFQVTSKTELTKPIFSADTIGDRVDVYSTQGWGRTGRFIIGNEEFEFEDKNVNQFIIKKRSASFSYQEGTSVYNYYKVSSGNVTFIVLGVLYDLSVASGAPYSAEGDFIEISDPGFRSIDPVIFDRIENKIRWILNEDGDTPVVSQNTLLTQKISDLNADVSAIYEDDQYFYICSSSYPSHIILDSTVSVDLKDQKHLKLIRKHPTNTTEVYKTPTRDVGVFIDGTIAFSHKDEEYLDYGKIEKITVTNKGSGYRSAPYVIINGESNLAIAKLSGNVVESIEINTDSVFNSVPEIEIVSGRNAVIEPIVTSGRITSLVITNPGEYYSSAPIIRITDRLGKGRFAEYKAIVSPDGRIVDFEQIDEGKFYTKENTIVEVIPVGSGASAEVQIKRWYKNRFEKLKTSLDDSYGYIFENYLPDNGYGYGRLANPLRLRARANDNISQSLIETLSPSHSPILGFAYDGNPIYGPYGYEDPSDPSSAIIRLKSGYVKKLERVDGPPEQTYPLGTFIDDYMWIPTVDSGKKELDKNNGRFCVTPDYPNGVYAYFITADSDNIPQFPYILGENFYSLPIDSNYNSSISQLDLPKNVKRLSTNNQYRNGFGVNAKIETVKPGFISGVDVVSSPKSFKVGNRLVFDNMNTSGKDASAFVSSVKGENVNTIKAKSSVVKIQTLNNCYLFDGEILKQDTTNAFGKIVGNIANDNVVVLEEVSGTFSNTDKFTMEDSSGNVIKVLNLLLDTNSTYTAGATLFLTDGKNKPNSNIATGVVLESTVNQNSVKVKVTSTDSFIVTNDYFLRSSVLSNTTGSKIVSISSLSENIESFNISDKYALVTTNQEHRLALNDVVNIDINPDDSSTETLYYVRKKIYQTVTLIPPSFKTRVKNSGIGSFSIFNQGSFKQDGVFTAEFNISNPSLKRSDVVAAKIKITVVSGQDTTFEILDAGKNFKTNDILTITKIESYSDISTVVDKFPLLGINHAGFAISNTDLLLENSSSLSENDYLKINDEIVLITAINRSTNIATVQRAQLDTVEGNHYFNNSVEVYNPKYKFNKDYRPLGSNANDPYVLDYDEETHKLTVSFDYGSSLENINSIVRSNFIFDQSVPSKIVSIFSVEDAEYKLEFSKDNIDFIINPVLNIQKYYSYKFDTSHSSMTNTYLDFSASLNYNIFTEELDRSDVAPGNVGSYIKLKLGFGANIASNTYDKKVPVNFKNYYYFIKADGVNTEGSYLNVIDDPLSGRKIVDYVTSNKFIYELSSEPQYNGSGTILYTTTSRFAIGQINTVDISNTGIDYMSVPVVFGCYVAEEYEASVSSQYDSITKSITSVTVENKGSNYVNPKIVVVNGDGTGARFNPVVSNGQIIRVDVISGGAGYTFAPELRVVEGSSKLYATSNTIGVPQTVKLLFNGGAFHNDKTILSKYTSSYSLLLSNFNEYDISPGQLVWQKLGNEQIASGVVANDGWKPGSNILKVRSIQGEFDSSLPLLDRFDNKLADIKSILYTTFNPNIKSYFDNIGYYKSDRGKLSTNSQKLTDSYFYQDYSYVIKSKTPIDIWRDLIKQTTHPAGFKLFGEVLIESEGSSTIPNNQTGSSRISKINLGLKSVTTTGTQRKITQSVIKYHNLNQRRGYGSVSIDTFNTEETLAYEIILDKPFDGDFDPSTGQIVGTKTFTMLDKKTNTAVSTYNENQLLISIDGIVQEPGKAFTVSNNQITFAEAPLGERIAEGQKIPAVPFYGKSLKFKNDTLNEKYLRKIRNIHQRNGRWLDSANQIRYNREFIANEAIGYAKEKFPDIAWNSLESKCKRDIGYILDAVEFDLRFGGNFKTVTYAEMYFDASNNLDFINDEKVETIDVFNFVLNLCAAAVRNWDVTFVNAGNEFTVIISPDSDIITVPSTFGIVPGMFVSSGSQFPDGTKVTEVISETQVKVSNKSFPDIGQFGYPPLNISATGVLDVNDEQIYSTISNEGLINVQIPGILVSSIVRGAVSQVTFYMSNINNGTFYDASNLIEKNKEYIKEEILGYVLDNYTIPSNEYITSNVEDYLNAVIHHLRYSGNAKIIQFGRKFYVDNKLIISYQLKNIVIDLLDKTTELMLLAMRNLLPVGTYTAITPFIDSEVLVDSNVPTCEDVQTTINSFYNNVVKILNKGANTVLLTLENTPKSGYWTTLLPYSNTNIILDNPIFNAECQDVLSAINSLSGTISDTLNNGKGTVDISLPDYFNGVTDTFELYYEDDSIVKTDPNEDLIISINGIVQNYNSYTIIRSENPSVTDKVKFSEVPKWDQNDSALSLQEATSVEKSFVYSMGSYEVLTINQELIPYVGKGPYLILDSEKGTVRKIDEDQYAIVFINGILQDSNSYSINGPNIIFSEKLNYFIPETGEEEYPFVEIRLLYGRDIEKTLTFYNFENQTYTNVIKTVFFGSGSYDIFVDWLRDGIQSEGAEGGAIKWAESEHSDVYIYQLNEETEELKILGKLRGYRKIDSGSWEIKFVSSINHTLIEETDIGFTGPKLIFTKDLDTDNILNIVLDLLVPLNEIFINSQDSVYGTITVEGELVVELDTTISSRFAEIVYSDSQGDIISDFDGTLERDSPRWIFDSVLKEQAWKERSFVYANIREGDQIQIDGENARREIISIPEVVTSTNFNKDQVVTDSYYGIVKATNYNDITRGEGLSVVAIIENGKVVDLEWNKRDWQIFFQTNVLLNPTAYQYYTPPILHFVPVNNKGGGARAEVIAYGGDILDIVLIDGGSGYTEPPQIVVARGFDVYKKDKRIADNIRILSVVPKLNASISQVSSQILIDSPSVSDIVSITSENLVTPFDYDIKITSIIEPVQKEVTLSSALTAPPIGIQIVPKLFVDSIISAEREIINLVATRFNVISTSTIQSVERQVNLSIKKVITDAIHLNPLPTINDIGAFLEIDLNSTDNIVYIANTRNFPDSGRLLIGNEIVTYDSKLVDRFLNVVRGALNTVPTDHFAGDYLRNLPDFTSIVPVGPVAVITLESVLSTVSTQPTEITKVTSSFDEVENNVSVISTVSNIDLRLDLLTNTSVSAVSNQTTVLYGIEEQIVRSIKFEIVPETKVHNIISVDVDSSLITSSSEVSVLDYSTVNNITSSTNTITSISKSIEVSFVSVDEVSVYNSSSECKVDISSIESVVTNKVDIISTESKVDIGLNLHINPTIYSVTKEIVSTYATENSDVKSIIVVYNNTEVNDVILLDIESSISGYSSEVTQLNETLTISITSTTNTISSVQNNIVTGIINNEIVSVQQSSTEYSLDLNSVQSVSTNYVSVIDTSLNVNNIIKTGVIDYLGDDTYTLGKAGPSITNYELSQSYDFGVAGVSDAEQTIEIFDLYYPFLTVGDFSDRANSNYTSSGYRFDATVPSINEYGTELTSQLLDTETNTINVSGTSGFPSSGKLYVGNEIIYYTSKTTNTFVGLSRGQQGTTAQTWSVNQYIRSLN